MLLLTACGESKGPDPLQEVPCTDEPAPDVELEEAGVYLGDARQLSATDVAGEPALVVSRYMTDGYGWSAYSVTSAGPAPLFTAYEPVEHSEMWVSDIASAAGETSRLAFGRTETFTWLGVVHAYPELGPDDAGPLVTIEDGIPESGLGESVAFVGPQLVVGLPGEGADNDGMVAAFSVADLPQTGQVAVADADCLAAGQGEDVWLGYALSEIGDTDGDGLDDLLLGSGNASWIVGGEAVAACDFDDRLPLAADLTDAYDIPSREAVGDLDGDGLPDVAVALQGWGGAELYLYSGTDGASLAHMEALTLYLFGSQLGPLRDLDGDGRSEFLASAYGRATVYVVPGGLCGEHEAEDVVSVFATARMETTNFGEYVASSVTGGWVALTATADRKQDLYTYTLP